MTHAADPYAAARVLGEAEAALGQSAAFAALPGTEREALRSKIERVRGALTASPQTLAPADPYETDIFARPMLGPQTGYGAPAAPAPAAEDPAAIGPAGQKSLLRTVSDLPAAAGAMSEELDFASFVASLVHGTFDAIVDSSIRQMEAFASLVSSLAQTVEDFSANNVSTNQVRDWLIEKYPADLQLVLPTTLAEQPRVVPRQKDGDWGASPVWLEDYDLDGEDLSEELIETQLIPQARLRLGEDRMRTLASMALLGMHKVKVERGEISARIRIRAKAADQALVHYAQSQDPAQQQSSWSARPGFSAPTAQAMISTAVNAQSDAAIAAELQGEVKIVFGSETVPLDSFVSDAQKVLLERTARTVNAPVSRVPDQTTQSVTTTPVQIEAPSDGGQT
ncbi:hypothetical protein EI983_14110 [Roseovarius faecimaris]|uniref:Uncharacterized protein n=1 Tax=Roseovarius faecimaris TaxID=2494550 RepID=A0A6I6ITV1_9RHOB|nr:hypothetical protein [Roseovarius faecimaris]QGX99333.1 hypothetical protein EI983_14110 [Roseovarius faecimaris]